MGNVAGIVAGKDGVVKPAVPRVVVFDKMKCNETEDTWGGDELTFTIWLDNALLEAAKLGDDYFENAFHVPFVDMKPFSAANPVRYRKNLNTGQTWDGAPFPLRVPLGRRLVLTLIDRDDPDADDNLGRKELTPASVDPDGNRRGVVKFRGDDASYDLHYHLEA